MRRLTVTALVLAAMAAAAGALGAAGDSGGEKPQYTVVLDNAFGLIPGADVKVAGVRAGKIEGLDIRRSDARALVAIKLTTPGFDSLRSDVFCEVRPQSLIGEYFLDCQPGRSPTVLRAGSVIPVNHTATTVPADLVGNILRRPYRERLSLILGEFGVALASRGEDLNATIRRAVPALRETDRVLAILRQNRFVLQQLTRDADTVLVALADNGANVSRFVDEARDTAAVSASRRVALRATFRKLPGFLRQLRPTLRDLGRAASDQTPALRDLRAAAPALNIFLTRLGPFANASRPALNTLGTASVTGRRTAIDARPTVAQLRDFTGPMPELAKNLAIVLQDLDDRDRAVEPDPDSPGGKGYTGLEALLQYTFDQTLGINAFDQRGYMLKINLILNRCGAYTDAAHAKSDPARTAACSEALGPSQPGINQPDPTGDKANEQKRRQRAAASALAAEAAAPAQRGDSQTAGELLDFLMAP